jgi:EAL domain-containing protein (putative c-di-GMP-specific phosphodiesterase class I)
MGPSTNVEQQEKAASGADEVVKSVRMVNEIKEALENGHIHLFYQPINDIKDGHVLGFEALMRWIHPERGIISPNEFIPIAEESGLIVEMSKFALHRACEDLGIIEKELGMTGLLYMSVNFTGKDLTAENFTNYVHDVLEKTNTTPKNVQIEITERMLMENPRAATQTLEALRDAGLKIAIDDFGTGYSSLSYLHYFPIDCLKIDRSFVSQMLENEGSMRLVQSIVSLAKNLDMTVTAEGIEEQAELDALRKLDCEYGQGYFYAKPISRDDIIQKLKQKEMIADPDRIHDFSEHQETLENVKKGNFS